MLTFILLIAVGIAIALVVSHVSLKTAIADLKADIANLKGSASTGAAPVAKKL